MANIEIPELLTPEIIDSIASNAEALKSALASKTEEEKVSLSHSKNCKKCCCPDSLKFNFFLCHVIIINKNADCKKTDKCDESDNEDL
ncbi:hypothetical protein CPAST_c14460 [Clostridium pasteurianum DSM 525 = ATCC 6013]|uniref:Uncharacterized protein n=1 Tax=Clostridium pasteurianum DSM 525 = ATCC 6013 TaxID=1262449 RepID=A0A0H3J8V7_CLOPA|nr:hypothetical protein [Clostridium pasteurianum]AJA47525.1 hypothetical protein CPAST_c14460 [Clostridium pasteurianum DSM 525 = ATCC 6013]AJA51513.1 hypothetical protein CLPA_c14460 [Clostridium pasteurianum DSM 525 = ATCC 6013]AOZ74843.1 hypothetical protein AQ983_06985 [Clostridium pasteurianum DSM 525 = ATCC 6013]AOZ78639.1 hypothetical protein AQ984_06975 [Clostridium pasteurianum]ELP57639.1 hypothetical protein F502_18476 [Clostridium pasteurianum DSM 525 = ATCC 6013]